MKEGTNENILKLRELTNKLSSEENKDDYKLIVKKLKSIVDEGKAEIESSKTPQSKIKCYESMCTTIAAILTGVKFI